MTHPRTLLLPALLAPVLLVAAGGAGALEVPPPAEDPVAAVDERQSRMSDLGDAAKAIGGWVRGEGPTLEDVRAEAGTIDEISTGMVALFPPETAVGVSDSDALPVIWEEWDRFAESIRALQDTTGPLIEAADGGDRAAIAQAFRQTGQACGACHDDFRAE